MRIATLAGALCALALALAAHAQSLTREVEFNIPAQGLPGAVLKFSEQSGIQVVVAGEDVSRFNAPQVRGRLSASEALERLLQGTHLTFKTVKEGTVALFDATGASTNHSSGQTRDVDSRAVVGGPRDAIHLAQVEGGYSAASPSSNEDKDSAQLSEVVVTAQKREERLRDVPISISVLSGDDLDRSTAQGISEELSRIPGVSATNTYIGGITQVSIRGVTASDPVLSGSSPIAYYVDSVPFGFVRHAIAPDASAYDTERVEVLRGPQGTLYGANALNGVMRVLTKDANLNRFEFKARGLGSSTQSGGENYRADMALNVPLVEGKLAARAVLGYEDLSGWIDRPNRNHANDAELLNMRLKINAQPVEQLSLGFSAWLSRSDFGGPNTADASGRSLDVIDAPTQVDFEAYGLRIGYDFARFSLTSATSYIHFNDKPVLVFETNFPIDSQFLGKVFSEELTLSSHPGGVWRWSAGAMYRNNEDLLFQTLPTSGNLIVSNYNDTSESFAIFGELTRIFMEGKLELTGGLRYFEDKVGLKSHQAESPVNPSDTFDALSPRVVLTMHPRSDLTLYASYAKGFRSGLFQQPIVVFNAPSIPSAEPDTLTNYEVGAKSALWGGRLSLETAVYFVDWQDVQQPVEVDIVQAGRSIGFGALVNGQSASGMGVDFAVMAELVRGLRLGATFGWNDLSMDQEVRSFGNVLYEKGDRLSRSPEYTTGVSLSYAFPIGGRYQGQFSASANYASKTTSLASDSTGVTSATSDALVIGRARFSLNAQDRWGISLFVDNITNEQGAALRPPYGLGEEFSTRPRPRTTGLQLEYRFQ